MIRIDLITGFLGAGKTEFMKRYARWLMKRGLRVGILVNDCGAVNVDMLLLRELEEEGCGLHMVAGACDADCHRRRFKSKLIAMGMSGYDRVLVEPSGVFDVDEFFDALCEEPLDRLYERGSVITVADACLEDDLPESADYLLASQLADAGVVVLSKTQLTTAEARERTLRRMEEALLRIKCGKELRPYLLDKDWDTLTDEDFERVMNSGCDIRSFVKRGTTDDSGFRSAYLLNKGFTVEELEEYTRKAFENDADGRVFRVKGFVRRDGGWMEFNATRQGTTLAPVKEAQDVVIVVSVPAGDDRKVK